MRSGDQVGVTAQLGDAHDGDVIVGTVSGSGR